MYCTICGKSSIEGSQFCTNCGVRLAVISHAHTESPVVNNNDRSGLFQRINGSTAAKVLLGLAILGFIIYSYIDEQVIETNNSALVSFNSGDGQTAISQLQSASEGALNDELKVKTLVNLAYAYASEGQNEKALVTFKEVLPLISTDTLKHNLVLGEISYLEGKPSLAKQYYEKAYSLDTNDFQVNNALALLFLDFEDLYPQYVDYPKALGYARKAYSINNSSLTLKHLGIALILNDKHQESLTYLNQMNLTEHPDINFWLGFAYASLENVEKAKYYFQQLKNSGSEVPPEVNEYLLTH